MAIELSTLSQLAEATAAQFAERHGRRPRWMAAAPGRVNLIGEHTDYNDGYVLPMAIERYTVVAADDAATADGTVTWHCARTHETATIDLENLRIGQPAWANYIRGVFAGFERRGTKLVPLDVLMASTVPLGGGLSSSAALEVATATLLEAVSGKRIDPVEKALLCQRAEHEFAGVPCGIMDQFVSTLGKSDHLLLLDCRSRQVELVPMVDPSVAVLITNSNVRHELAGGEYAERRTQCETAARALRVPSLRDATPEALSEARSRLDPVVFRRARHVVSEIERTLHAAAGIRAGNWDTVGQLMYASHLSLRDDYEVSCRELDLLVDIAQQIGHDGGVLGCRMTGGGFGGCTVSLVRTASVSAIRQQVRQAYLDQTGIEPYVFVSRPGSGAAILQGA